MARKSALQKAMEKDAFGHEVPKAPDHLTEDEAKVWDTVFKNVAVNFIPRESYPILELYCRHVVKERLYASKLRELEDTVDFTDHEHLKMVDRLSAMTEREGRKIVSCARSLRLTTQALRTADVSPSDRTTNPMPKPWETA